MTGKLQPEVEKVLRRFAALEAEDPDGAWAAYYHEIIGEAGDLDAAFHICSILRRKKLLTGQGRGRDATYYINDAGKAHLAKLDAA